jgi:hypothetical protein
MSTTSYGDAVSTVTLTATDDPSINIVQSVGTAAASRQDVSQLPLMEQYLRHARNGDLPALMDLVELGTSGEQQHALDTGKYAKIVSMDFDFNYRGSYCHNHKILTQKVGRA